MKVTYQPKKEFIEDVKYISINSPINRNSDETHYELSNDFPGLEEEFMEFFVNIDTGEWGLNIVYSQTYNNSSLTMKPNIKYNLKLKILEQTKFFVYNNECKLIASGPIQKIPDGFPIYRFYFPANRESDINGLTYFYFEFENGFIKNWNKESDKFKKWLRLFIENNSTMYA